MCPGSAVKGRRILGSYCTLWNGLRNARCLPLFFLFFLGLGRITCCRQQALKITWCICVCVCDAALAHGCLWSLTSTFSSVSLQWGGPVATWPPFPSTFSSIFKQTRWAFGSLLRGWRLRGKTRHLCKKKKHRKRVIVKNGAKFSAPTEIWLLQVKQQAGMLTSSITLQPSRFNILSRTCGTLIDMCSQARPVTAVPPKKQNQEKGGTATEGRGERKTSNCSWTEWKLNVREIINLWPKNGVPVLSK